MQHNTLPQVFENECLRFAQQEAIRAAWKDKDLPEGHFFQESYGTHHPY
jgi:hypothetical protein